MYQLALKAAVVSLIPSVVTGVFNHVAGYFTHEEKHDTLPAPKSKRKHHDTTQITQRMYDYICSNHVDWITSSDSPSKRTLYGQPVPTQKAFVAVMNRHLGLDKSAPMACIFNRVTPRSSLPTGQQLALDLTNTQD